MTLDDLLQEQARQRPNALALVDDRRNCARSLTYSQLTTEVANAAAWMVARGVTRGSAVLTFVPMSAELYIALLAMFRLGAVALFLDPSAGREHLERCCARWTPDALLAIPKAHLLRLRSPALRRIARKWHTGSWWLPGAERWPAFASSQTGADSAPLQNESGSAPFPTAGHSIPTHSPITNDGSPHPAGTADQSSRNISTVRPEDPALVTFTSGSTGVPKGAVRTHAFLLAQYRALAPSIALEPGEVDLATLPVFTLANLAAGVTTVIPSVDLRRPGAVEAAPLFNQIKQRKITRITASPAFFERLVAHGLAAHETLPSLTKLYTGGAPVYPRLLDAMQQLAPRAHAVAVYGSTEAEPVAHVATNEISPEDLEAMRHGHGLLAGEPVAEVELRVLHDRWGTPRRTLTAAELDAEALAPNQAGEIVVSGEHVLAGYLGGIGDEETKFRVDGRVWHRTGDAGLIDERGRLWLLGRCSAKIDDSRGVLYPFGVECVAMTFSAVRRAAALAHDHRRLLIIETGAAGPEAAQLQQDLHTATRWAHIDEIRLVAAIPVDARHNAKIDYPALRRILG
jgi:olefin beta-lactone synthetase